MAALEPGKIRNVAVVGHRGTGKTEAHGRNQALSARQDACVGSVFLKMAQGFVGGLSTKVLEGGGYHLINLLLSGGKRNSILVQAAATDFLHRIRS